MRCRFAFSVSSFCRSADSCSEESDAGVDVIISQIVQLLSHISRHGQRLAPATIQNLLGSRQSDFLVFRLHAFGEYFERAFGMLTGFRRNAFRAAARIA